MRILCDHEISSVHKIKIKNDRESLCHIVIELSERKNIKMEEIKNQDHSCLNFYLCYFAAAAVVVVAASL